MSQPFGRAPALLAILVCETIIRDEQSHNFSLVGVFNTIHAMTFPCIQVRMHVFVSLTDGRGACESRLCVVHRETDRVIAEAHGRLVFPPDARAVVDMNFELRQTPFEQPGQYSVDFYVEDELVGSRPFAVVHTPGPDKPPFAR